MVIDFYYLVILLPLVLLFNIFTIFMALLNSARVLNCSDAYKYKNFPYLVAVKSSKHIRSSERKGSPYLLAVKSSVPIRVSKKTPKVSTGRTGN